jgi:eukaryotic-like serine/threonine-protein kinase
MAAAPMIPGDDGPSIALDSRALVAMDELLDCDDEARTERLTRLRQTDPALHERVLRLLRASDLDVDTHSHLGAPLMAALQAAHERQAGDRVGRYRLLQVLGRGGMSVVWLAERADGQLQREVALKLPLMPHLSGVLNERFARERDVLATLMHPHIAQLFDAGVAADGQPFIALEAVAGQPITTYADAQRLNTEQRLGLFLQVLAAVAHAHARMVVHRDLKPGNILVSAQGQVKLLDFGIAKLLAPPPGTADLTRDGLSALTPRYAAPEQVLGQPVTAATDVYAAGLVLHELLTGRLPYAVDEASLLDVVQAVTRAEVRPPGLSKDIDTVLLKALHKSPAERYGSIDRMAEDLRRVLAHRPILARRVPWWQRAQLLVRRHRLASGGLAVGGLALALALVTAWQQSRETAAQRDRVDAVRAFVFAMFDDAEPTQGQDTVSGRDIVDAAVARARIDWAAEPRLRGELLAELGRVYQRLELPTQSKDTLEEALALLAPQARADDAALNRARALLARTLLAQDAPRATELARQALAGCSAATASCAQVRALALYALAAIGSWQGRGADALQHARAMVRESEAGFGAGRPPVALAYETLGSTAFNQGDLREAAAALEQAQHIAQGQAMKANNRNRLDLLQAVVLIEWGQAAKARALLADLTARPAPPAEQRVQWRWISAAELALGHADAALAAADRAGRDPDAEAPGVTTWLARRAWALAASQAGRHGEAARGLDAVLDGLLASGFDIHSAALARVRLQAIQVRLREGRVDMATELLRTASDRSGSLSPLATAEWLDVRACVAALDGEAEAALQMGSEAAALYARVLPSEHPLRLRSDVLRLQVSSGAAPADSSALQLALARYRAHWADDSPLRTRSLQQCNDVL